MNAQGREFKWILHWGKNAFRLLHCKVFAFGQQKSKYDKIVHTV